MKIYKNRYKVLTHKCFIHPSDILTKEYFKRLNKDNMRIKSKFNRFGVYFDRLDKRCWIESQYGSFELDANDFKRELEQLNIEENPLTDKVYDCLQSLYNNKFLFGKMLEIYENEKQRRYLRNLVLSTKKVMIDFLRK